MQVKVGGDSGCDYDGDYGNRRKGDKTGSRPTTLEMVVTGDGDGRRRMCWL